MPATIAEVVLCDLEGAPFELAHYSRRRHVLCIWASW